MNNSVTKSGSWAVLTGATSGIGRAFADELAARGMNLLIVARNVEALERTQRELMGNYRINVDTLSLDLSVDGAAQQLFDAAVAHDADLLISNAGFGGLGAFLDKPLEDHLAVFRLNGTAQIEIAHLFANHYAKRAGRGSILLLGSTVGLHGTPFAASYSASKAGTIAIAEALNAELKGSGVRITTVSPGVTGTPAVLNNPDADLSKLPIPPMDPRQVVLEGLAALERNEAHHVVGRLNRFMTGFLGRRILSRSASVKLWGGLLGKLVYRPEAPSPVSSSRRVANAH